MKFAVTDTLIVCTDPTIRVVGDNKYTVEFTFDSTWDGLTKTAKFIQGDIEQDIVLVNDKCVLTNLKKGSLTVGVYGANKTTIKSNILVKASVLNETGLVADPISSVYIQLLEIIDAEKTALDEYSAQMKSYFEELKEMIEGGSSSEEIIAVLDQAILDAVVLA